MIIPRCSSKIGDAATLTALTSAATSSTSACPTRSTSDACAVTSATSNARAALWSCEPVAIVVGSARIPMRDACGTILCSNSSRFTSSSLARMLIPVVLPPGRHTSHELAAHHVVAYPYDWGSPESPAARRSQRDHRPRRIHRRVVRPARRQAAAAFRARHCSIVQGAGNCAPNPSLALNSTVRS
jgi:hypothetical protein